MAKKVTGIVKLQIPAGKATPAPPVGTARGPHGVNIMGFCKQFNADTQGQSGDILPVPALVRTANQKPPARRANESPRPNQVEDALDGMNSRKEQGSHRSGLAAIRAVRWHIDSKGYHRYRLPQPGAADVNTFGLRRDVDQVDACDRGSLIREPGEMLLR